MDYVAACGLEEATLLLVEVKVASEGAHGSPPTWLGPEQGPRHAGLGAKEEASAPARLEDASLQRPLSRRTKGGVASKIGSTSPANPAKALSCHIPKESSSSARIETSSLPASRLFGYLATPRLGLGATAR